MAEAGFLAGLKGNAGQGAPPHKADSTERGPCGGICALCPNRHRHAAALAEPALSEGKDRATAMQ